MNKFKDRKTSKTHDYSQANNKKEYDFQPTWQKKYKSQPTWQKDIESQPTWQKDIRILLSNFKS